MTTAGIFQAEAYIPQPARAPCVLVLFGGAGALAKRKLAPALYNLAADHLLPERFALVAAARTERDDSTYRPLPRDAIEANSRRPPDPAILTWLLERSHYACVRPDRPADWTALSQRLARIEAEHGTSPNRLLYLSTPPDAYPALIEALGAGGLAADAEPAPRIVIEKPFGRDRPTAVALDSLLDRWFDESGIYRIDHFLAKETVQNLLVFRLANAIFEPLLRREFVHDVQITVAEDGGVDDRGSYYDATGAMSDMVQNHLLQLLCLIAMAPPLRLEAEAIRDEKIKVLRAIGPLTPEQVASGTVRGQYVGAGEQAGYLDEPGISAGSRTETYVALRLEVRNARWAGVPFYLRTGKRLRQRLGEIVVTFRREPAPLFGPDVCDFRQPNRLVFRLQPAEGISVVFDAKAPGPRMLLRPVRMNMDYARSFEMASPEAYERLLLDALKGESSLFARADEVEESWKIVDSIRAAWVNAGASPLRTYPAGSWGPDRSVEIFADPETSWQTP